MSRFKSALIAATALTLVGTVPAAVPASAADGYDYGYATRLEQNEINTDNNNTQTVGNDITTMQNNVVSALRDLSGQNTVNNDAAVHSQANMMDTQDARHVQSEVEGATYNALQQAASGASTCNIITADAATQGMFQTAAEYRDAIVSQQLAYLAGVGYNPSAAVRDSVQESNHCTVGATEADVQNGVCKAVTTPGGATQKTGADVDVNTIFGTTTGGVIPPSSRLASNGFLLNAFEPQTDSSVTPRLMAENPTAAEHLEGQDLTSEARQSIAYNVGAGIVADNTPLPSGTQAGGNAGSGVTLKDWAEGTAKQVTGYNADGNNFPNGVSRDAAMKLRAKSWFWNPSWTASVDQDNQSQNTKDLTEIVAYQVYQNWLLYKQVQKLNLSVAALLSIANGAAQGQ